MGIKVHQQIFQSTSFLHERLRYAQAIRLCGHFARVSCCVAITRTFLFLHKKRRLKDYVCVVCGDSMGYLGVYYLSRQELATQQTMKEDGAMRMRNRPEIKVRNAHNGSINCMRYIEGTAMLLTAGDDGILRVWDLREELATKSTLHCIHKLVFHTSCILDCSLDPSGTIIASTGLDGIVAVWILGISTPLLTIMVGRPCHSVNILDKDPSLILVGEKDSFSVWDLKAQPHYTHFARALQNRIQQNTSLRPCDGIERLCKVFTPIQGALLDESLLLRLDSIGDNKGPVNRIYDEASRCYVYPFRPHHSTAQLRNVHVLFNGRVALTTASDHTSKLWNLFSRQGIISLEPGIDQTSISVAATLSACSQLCSNQRFLYAADSVNCNVNVWDLSTPFTSKDAVLQPSYSFPASRLDYAITSITLSNDDTILVIGDASGALQLSIAI